MPKYYQYLTNIHKFWPFLAKIENDRFWFYAYLSIVTIKPYFGHENSVFLIQKGKKSDSGKNEEKNRFDIGQIFISLTWSDAHIFGQQSGKKNKKQRQYDIGISRWQFFSAFF